MGLSDHGNDPVALAQTRCPCASVERSDHARATLVVPGGPSLRAQFDLVGLGTLGLAGPVNAIAGLDALMAKRLL